MVANGTTNPATLLAICVAEAALKVGVTDVVVCPGSRSAPLAWQFAALANKGRIKLHTRIDEREAAFLALGLAKKSNRPVPVVVTSGTAVANLLPAVVEAHHSGVPLIVLSADRLAAVRRNSAPQTTIQPGMFENFVKTQVDTATATEQIYAAFQNSITGHFGPVHINTQFDLPLMPTDPTAVIAEVAVAEFKEVIAESKPLTLPARGLLIVGDISPGPQVEKLAQFAKAAGYPIIWEPTAQLHSSDNALSYGALLLQTGKTPKPDVVISVGLIGLSRSVLALLKSTPKHIAIHLPNSGSDLPNPVLSAQEIINYIPQALTPAESSWLSTWQELDQLAGQVVIKNLNSETLSGPNTAVELWNQLADDSNLFISASWPVRHIEMYAQTRTGLTVFGNRGVNGIDGLISTACGVALNATQRTYLLIGDIAFLHGMAGLNISDFNVKPNLTVVVVDNDGSGIFSQLEQGDPAYSKYFEQIFGTPHGRDLWVIAEALGVPAARVTTKSEFVSALNRTNKIPGIHVIVCTTGQRSAEQAQITKITKEVNEAL